MTLKREVRRNSLILFFSVSLIFILVLVIAGPYLFKAYNSLFDSDNNEVDIAFEIDQILIKVILREREFISRDIRVMNIAEQVKDIELSIEGDIVKDIIKVSKDKIFVKPGETQVVLLNFSSTQANLEFQPGVYVGKFVAKSSDYVKSIPTIIEIESRNVLFDFNIDSTAKERKIEQGSSAPVEIRIFNLQGIGPVSLEVEYFIKDLNDNTIISESETVVVKTQNSFYKTISIPNNIKVGDYIFIANARYGSSIGTGSYLFEVVEKSTKESFSFIGLCKNSPFCLLPLFFIIIISCLMILYGYGYLFYKYAIKKSSLELAKKKKIIKYRYILRAIIIIIIIISLIIFIRGLGDISVLPLVKKLGIYLGLILTGIVLMILLIIASLLIYKFFSKRYPKFRKYLRNAEERRKERIKNKISELEEENKLRQKNRELDNKKRLELIEQKSREKEEREIRREESNKSLKRKAFDLLHKLGMVKTEEEKKELKKEFEIKVREKEELKKRKEIERKKKEIERQLKEKEEDKVRKKKLEEENKLRQKIREIDNKKRLELIEQKNYKELVKKEQKIIFSDKEIKPIMTWKLKKCQTIILKAKKSLAKDMPDNAEKLYDKAKEIYLTLNEDHKEVVYEELLKLYEELLKLYE